MEGKMLDTRYKMQDTRYEFMGSINYAVLQKDKTSYPASCIPYPACTLKYMKKIG